ncbi:hypothetical protein OSTOST_25209 [Ostertagia ostertagi]
MMIKVVCSAGTARALEEELSVDILCLAITNERNLFPDTASNALLVWDSVLDSLLRENPSTFAHSDVDICMVCTTMSKYVQVVKSNGGLDIEYEKVFTLSASMHSTVAATIFGLLTFLATLIIVIKLLYSNLQRL